MIFLYFKFTTLCLLGLVAKEVESGDEECCSTRKDNKVELLALTDTMLELIGKCDFTPSDTSANNLFLSEANTREPKPTPSPPPPFKPATKPAPSPSKAPARAPANLNNCDQLHEYPFDCLNKFCDYDCTKKKCVKSGTLSFVKGPSSNYCFNPCQCNKAGFAYNVLNGECKDRKPICEKLQFFPGSCQRTNKGTVGGKSCPDVYYGYNGVLCKSNVQKGNCQIAETIIAVNLATKSWHERTFQYFNGPKQLTRVTDQDNVQYKFDHEIQYEDPGGLVMGDQSNSETVNGKKTDLTAVCGKPLLYGSQIWGDHNKKGPSGRAKGWKGVKYNIPLTKDGIYELVLKNVENQPKYVIGTRAFNVFFNGVWILPEVDILHTTTILHGIDWIINFQVTGGGKKLKMLGYEDSDLNGSAKLAFYYGICGNEDENFHVASFAVNKFK